jgi:hypothetical protein
VSFRDPNSTATATGASSSSGDGDRHHNDILHAALSYAKRGWAVLPLWWIGADGRCACDNPNCGSAGKHPIGKPEMAPHGVKSATVDLDVIWTWWQCYPQANVGIATGEPSGFWVLDIDGPEGAATLAEMEDHHGALPFSVRAQTGGGGEHRLFRHNGESIKNRVKDIGGGLDVRATGGYIVAPPSIHRTGAIYQWAPGPDEPAAAPSWLIEQVSGGTRRQRERPPDQDRQQDHQQDKRSMNGHGQPSGGPADAWAAAALENESRDVEQAGKGGRNDQLNRSAFSLGQLVGGAHLKHDPVVKALFAAATRNGSVADDGEDAVMATINSGMKGGKAQPRKKPESEPRQTEQKHQDAGSKPNGANGSAGKAGDGAEDAGPDRAGHKPDMSGDDDVYELLDLDGMAALPDPEWLVEDMVPAAAMTLIFGASNNFKSFLALDMALSVATGRPWQGREVKQGAVIYLASEGAIGVGKLRARGWLEHHGVREKPPFRMIRQEVLMNDPASLKKLMHTIDSRLGGELALIVCDVLSGTRKGSEVDDEAAAAHVRALQTLVRIYGASVMSVTHTGWSDPERARGHTHTWGSYDSRLKVEGDADTLTTTLSVNRHKDADTGGPMTFNLLPVPVPGMTVQKGARKGEPVTTLVPQHDPDMARTKPDNPGHRLSDAAQIAYAELCNAINTQPETPPRTSGIPPSVRVAVREIAFRDRCYRAGISKSDKPDSRLKAYQRASDQLVSRGMIKEMDGYVWLVKAETSETGQPDTPRTCPAMSGVRKPDRTGHVSLDMSGSVRGPKEKEGEPSRGSEEPSDGETIAKEQHNTAGKPSSEPGVDAEEEQKPNGPHEDVPAASQPQPADIEIVFEDDP